MTTARAMAPSFIALVRTAIPSPKTTGSRSAPIAQMNVLSSDSWMFGSWNIST